MPVADADRLARAVAAIDAANAEDPTLVPWTGGARPKELLHAELMTVWVQRLDPAADEAQLLAARAHHLRRWESPRDEFPDGRAGYLRWRTAASKRHAELVATLLADEGYDGATIERVRRIVGKVGLGTDRAVQVHEDALCLTFLQTQVDEVAERLGEDKMLEVLVRTLPKMSEQGRRLAAGLALSAAARDLLDRAVAATPAVEGT